MLENRPEAVLGTLVNCTKYLCPNNFCTPQKNFPTYTGHLGPLVGNSFTFSISPPPKIILALPKILFPPTQVVWGPLLVTAVGGKIILAGGKIILAGGKFVLAGQVGKLF